MTNVEALAELLARTPRLTAGYGAPADYTRAAESLIERGVRLLGPGSVSEDAEAALSALRGSVRELLATEGWGNCAHGSEKRERFERARKVARVLTLAQTPTKVSA